MELYKISMQPKSSISSLPGSDTLFGAIMWGIREINGEDKLKEYLSLFKEKRPPFIISSAFPCFKGETEIFFLPKPLLPTLDAEEVQRIGEEKISKEEWSKKYLIGTVEAYKNFKKGKYVTMNIFRQILKGEYSENKLFQDYLTKNIILQSIGENKHIREYGGTIKLLKNFLFNEEEFNSLFSERDKNLSSKNVIVHNVIDRFSGSTKEGGLFFSEEYFVEFSLYFLILANDEKIKELTSILYYLKDTGIGRDRSIGKNIFDLSEPEKIDLNLDFGNTHFVTLSRYIPDINEIALPLNIPTYEILPVYSKVESRREFSGENIWKRPVIYFTEGSIFQVKNGKKEYYGIAPEVKKFEKLGKTILQNGLCIPAFLNLEVKI